MQVFLLFLFSTLVLSREKKEKEKVRWTCSIWFDRLHRRNMYACMYVCVSGV